MIVEQPPRMADAFEDAWSLTKDEDEREKMKRIGDTPARLVSPEDIRDYNAYVDEQERLSRAKLSMEQIDAALASVGIKGGMNNFSHPDEAVSALMSRLKDHMNRISEDEMLIHPSEYDGPDDR
tara:strand:+ start:2623 stop:2994 length:372 start_codon:yes stop_codon:yes gene_type:complete